VEGVISQDTTWTLSGSPYVIAGNVTVANGAVLTIEPGVEVEFNKDLSLTVEGSLYAVGTSDRWISFTSNNLPPGLGDWNTIEFAGAENESFTLENCNVEYAKNGITIQSLGKAVVRDSRLANHALSGVHVIAESNLIIEGNTIELNTNGISSTGDLSSGIQVLDNVIASNVNGIYLYASSSGISRIRNITILRNVLSSNDNGIEFYLFPLTWEGMINNVTISENTINLNKNGIYLHIWGGSAAYTTNQIYDVSISENTVLFNEKYGIYLNSSGPWLGSIYRVSISNNKVASNEVGVYLFANYHYPHIQFDVVITNNTVWANINKGIHVFGGAFRELEDGIRTNMTHNSISYSACGAFYEGDTENIAHLNDIHHNTYGTYVSYSATVNATHNYWEDSTGPYHEVLNTDGKGNPVNGNGTDLVFKPFLTYAVVNRPPVAVLEVNETVTSTDQTITFNALKSSDDSYITSYYFDFGDNTNSGWITDPVVTHAYTSPDTYTASLTVSDDLGFENNNRALVSIKVQPTLLVSIALDSETVESGEEFTITIRLTDESDYVPDVNITLFSDKGGIFSPNTGNTNSTGHFVSTFTAPTVTEDTLITITAKATKTEHWDGQAQIEAHVFPEDVPSGIEIIWLLAAIAVTILLIVAVLKTKKKKQSHL
jgi:hypothetical protein